MCLYIGNQRNQLIMLHPCVHGNQSCLVEVLHLDLQLQYKFLIFDYYYTPANRIMGVYKIIEINKSIRPYVHTSCKPNSSLTNESNETLHSTSRICA